MQIAVVGLGRMGANIVRRLMRAGHECVVYDVRQESVTEMVGIGAIGTTSLEDLVAKLKPPRAVWMMLPAAIVDRVMPELMATLAGDDVLIDGGNSYYRHDMARAAALKPKGIHYVDVGTSGGVWGLERGFCLMIGGEEAVVRRLDPIFAALAPGGEDADAPTGTAARGYLHCGPSGAGHFVKMIHNGIEYGVMAAYAEGFNVLQAANVGRKMSALDAETAPLQSPEAYAFDFDLAAIAEVWRHGSVIASWLLDLTADSLRQDRRLAGFRGQVSDSGEGRWTIKAAIDEGVPVPVLSASLFARFSSRGEAVYADKLLSAMRQAFGGHVELPTGE